MRKRVIRIVFKVVRNGVPPNMFHAASLWEGSCSKFQMLPIRVSRMRVRWCPVPVVSWCKAGDLACDRFGRPPSFKGPLCSCVGGESFSKARGINVAFFQGCFQNKKWILQRKTQVQHKDFSRQKQNTRDLHGLWVGLSIKCNVIFSAPDTLLKFVPMCLWDSPIVLFVGLWALYNAFGMIPFCFSGTRQKT